MILQRCGICAGPMVVDRQYMRDLVSWHALDHPHRPPKVRVACLLGHEVWVSYTEVVPVELGDRL